MLKFIFTFIITVMILLFSAPKTRPTIDILTLEPPTDYELSKLSQIKNRPHLLKLALKTEQRKNVRNWIHFKLGQYYVSQKQTAKACEHYADLSFNNHFILKQLATIRALESCDTQSKHLGMISQLKLNEVEPWLKGSSIQALYTNAVNREDQFDQMKLLYELSKKPLPMKKKVSYSEQALQLAVSLNHQEFAEKMQKRIKRLQPSAKSANQKIKTLVHARKFKKALAQYKQVFRSSKSSFKEKYNALYGIRKVRKLQLNDSLYIKATEDLARFVQRNFNRYRKPSPSMIRKHHDTQVTLARTYWTKGQTDLAIKTLKHAQRDLRKKYSHAKIYFIQGRIQEEKQNLKTAIYWYKQSLKQDKLSNSLHESTLWQLAWNLRKTNQLKLALSFFDKLLSNTKDNFNRHRYSFWKARTMKDLGDQAGAEQSLQELVTNDVLGYYGLLAARELKLNLTHLYMRSSETLFEPGASQINLLKTRWLLRLGENDLAAHRLKAIARELRADKNENLIDWLKIFGHYLKTKKYGMMFADLGRLNKELKQTLLAINPEIYFPRPFLKTVNAAGKKFGLSPSMIYAIMRQESAFNPKARSFAHAMGLMQLLPQVAKYTADRYNINYSGTASLFNPKTNIPLGTAFLKQLFNRYQGQFILSVASYNASERAIQGWVKTRFGGNSIEFIEDIPYSETRTYVRLVMRNYIYYEVQKTAPIASSFPEWPLSLEVAAR